MEDYPDVSIVRSDGELLQIMDRRASKGTALRLVATTSGTSEVFRIDSLVAALARNTL